MYMEWMWDICDMRNVVKILKKKEWIKFNQTVDPTFGEVNFAQC